VARRWDAFVDTFTYLFSIEGAVYFACASVGDEGGARAGPCADRQALRLPRAPAWASRLLVLWPVLYTDVTETWKLVSRRERLAVGLAGSTAELGVRGARHARLELPARRAGARRGFHSGTPA
jgi:putative peptide zinc metalloprotease protein